VGGAITSDYWAVTQILLYVEWLAYTVQVLSVASSRGLRLHTVAFLPVALRYGTRTLLGYSRY